jgi:hypothetical protein
MILVRLFFFYLFLFLFLALFIIKIEGSGTFEVEGKNVFAGLAGAMAHGPHAGGELAIGSLQQIFRARIIGFIIFLKKEKKNEQRMSKEKQK